MHATEVASMKPITPIDGNSGDESHDIGSAMLDVKWNVRWTLGPDHYAQ